MKPPQRKRVVSETFEATVDVPVMAENQRLGKGRLNAQILEKFLPGMRVRVKVTKLERGK